jgi:hypothetical protein
MDGQVTHSQITLRVFLPLSVQKCERHVQGALFSDPELYHLRHDSYISDDELIYLSPKIMERL